MSRAPSQNQRPSATGRGGGSVWTAGYNLLFLSNFFSWLSYNMITPVLSEYSVSIGASLSMAGVVSGLFAMASLCSRPVSGLASDKWNRKGLVALFTGVMAASLAVYAFVPSVPVLLLFRTLHGVAFGLSSTAGLAMVGELIPGEKLAEGINYYSVSQILSAAFGPGLGVWVSDAFGHRACLAAGAALLAGATLAACLIPYAPAAGAAAPPVGKGWLSRLIEQRVLLLGAVYGSFTVVNGVVSTYLVIFARERGIEGAGWHFTVNALCLLLVRALLGRYGQGWSLGKKLLPCFVFLGLSLVCIGFARSLFPLLLAGVFKAVGQGVGMPVVQTAALEAVAPERRGVAGSTVYIGGDTGQTVGPMVGGAAAQQLGYGPMFLLCLLPLGAAALLLAHHTKPKG